MNRLQLIGNVGAEPEVKTGNNGKTFVKLTVATTERGYTKQDGTRVEDQTEWHRILFFGSKADVISKYVHKGDKIYVEGKIKTRQYKDHNGNNQYSTDIFGEDFEFLTQKPRQQQTYSEPAIYVNKGQGKVDMYATAMQNTNPNDDDEKFPF